MGRAIGELSFFDSKINDMNFIEKIKQIISQNIGTASTSEMIAYYGLTSKSELQYRDIIAFNLYKNLKNEYFVTREWNKCDLAILNKETGLPLLLLEFKVCYNVDLYKTSTIKEYVTSIKNDFIKSKKLGNEETEIYSILFIFKPEQVIPDNLKKIVKYSSSINAGLKKLDYKNLDNIGEANLRNEFENIEFIHVRKDNAFGINCGLGYCIISE